MQASILLLTVLAALSVSCAFAYRACDPYRSPGKKRSDIGEEGGAMNRMKAENAQLVQQRQRRCLRQRSSLARRRIMNEIKTLFLSLLSQARAEHNNHHSQTDFVLQHGANGQQQQEEQEEMQQNASIDPTYQLVEDSDFSEGEQEQQENESGPSPVQDQGGLLQEKREYRSGGQKPKPSRLSTYLTDYIRRTIQEKMAAH